MAALARIAKTGAPRVPEALGCAHVSKRHKSSDVTLANYKRGTGGRSSFSGVVATVFGSNSVLGRILVSRLGKNGSQIILPYRCDPIKMQGFKLLGDLGQVLYQPFDLKNEAAIRDACKYSTVVINLIGQEFETRNFSFDQVHVEGAARLAKIAKEMGVERFIHVSALNAGEKSSYFLPDGSKFLRSKADGEKAVRSEFPEAIIMRPSDFINDNDRFINPIFEKKVRLFKRRIIRSNHYLKWLLPVYEYGQNTKMPIVPRNVAQGIMAAISDPDAPGKTYNCVGPREYKLLDLYTFAMNSAQAHRVMLTDDMRGTVFRAKWMQKVYMTAGIPKPKITLDRMERDAMSDVIDPSLPMLSDLGIQVDNVEDALYYQHRDRSMINLPKGSLAVTPNMPWPKRPDHREVAELKAKLLTGGAVPAI